MLTKHLGRLDSDPARTPVEALARRRRGYIGRLEELMELYRLDSERLREENQALRLENQRLRETNNGS